MNMIWALFSVLMLIWTLATVRLAVMLPLLRSHEQKSPVRKRKRRVRIFAFLGSGGHTGEMLRILGTYKAQLLDCSSELLVGYSDSDSVAKFEHWRQGEGIEATRIEYVPLLKAREVGSGLSDSVVSVSRALLQSFHAVRHVTRDFSPDMGYVVLLNGPGTCCVLVFWLRLLEFFTFRRFKLLYVESLARTETLSLTGRLLQPIVDEFVVQWPELARKYPRAHYYGVLV
ncbi:HGR042Cp [Eremothecium sinecaudum]|uniref:UDP-N-acetylglucosamine transferase subunit ALG14 n=1 Tax=Eremothecium sinecaudum TaxID=45286 RepID=A0A109UY83_9SACH|nr:HGR042Cp [Eremothecium sinecaudum]AMD22381.1 HGR042Cp [Eremothecium sinecaudum]